jgi:hypothetical protein
LRDRIAETSAAMIALFWLLLALSVSPFKSKNGLAAETLRSDIY